MLKVLGIFDLIGSILLLGAAFNLSFPWVLVLFVAVILLIKSTLNLWSVAGLTDFASGLFILGFLYGIDLEPYLVMIIVLSLILAVKSVRSFLS